MTTQGTQSAGVETNSTQITYVPETVFAAASPPTTGWKTIRYVSENLAGNKSRQRPNEINLSREATQGVTVSESAAGTINGALSYNTYDDFFASAMSSTFPTPIVATGTGTDMIIAIGGAITITAAASKWTGFVAGQWIKLAGYTNGVNNNFYRIISLTSTVLTVAAPFNTPVAETPTVAATIKGCQMTNASVFSSLFIQQQLAASASYLTYPGSYVTGFALSGQIGQFVTANFPIISTQEKQVTTATTGSGSASAAPSGTIHNTVGNFLGITWNDVVVSATVDQFNLTVDNSGATAEYGLGSPFAAGILSGTFTANGSMRMYFKDFTYYTLFKAETAGRLSIATRDAAGNGYVFTLPNALLLNPQVSAGGPGQAVMATFTIEGNPQTGGGTLQIDRLVTGSPYV